MKIRPYFLALIATCVFYAFGCEKKADKTDDPLAAKEQLLVKVGNRSLRSLQPAILSVAFREENRQGIAELSLEIENEVSLVLNAPYRSLPTFSVPAIAGPIVGGSANLFVGGKPVTGVYINVSISHGRITGSTNGLDITFNGNVAVRCDVDPSRINSGIKVPTTAVGPDHVLVQDERFRSPECAPVYTAYR
jgi:hypothetical protein